MNKYLKLLYSNIMLPLDWSVLTGKERSRLREKGVPVPLQRVPLLSHTDYSTLTTYQRYHLRKKGVDVPLQYCALTGADHPNWKGDAVTVHGARKRALKLYRNIGPCTRCGAEKSERHHVDGNTKNNVPENIAILCRRCHLTVDGRLERWGEIGKLNQPMASILGGEAYKRKCAEKRAKHEAL
jgi:hypothetical protein